MAETKDVKEAEFEIKIDTSKMSKEKAEAMMVAESSREDKWASPSFAGGLFMGKFQPELIVPFPEQSADDKLIGDKLCKEVADYLRANLDPDEVDRTREVPKKVLDQFTTMGLWAMKIPKEYGGSGPDPGELQPRGRHGGVLLRIHRRLAVGPPIHRRAPAP